MYISYEWLDTSYDPKFHVCICLPWVHTSREYILLCAHLPHEHSSCEYMLPVSPHFLCVQTSCESTLPMYTYFLCTYTSCKPSLPVWSTTFFLRHTGFLTTLDSVRVLLSVTFTSCLHPTPIHLSDCFQNTSAILMLHFRGDLHFFSVVLLFKDWDLMIVDVSSARRQIQKLQNQVGFVLCSGSRVVFPVFFICSQLAGWITVGVLLLRRCN